MSTEKSQAIVIRVIDFSESSCVITMMTRDFGKISALAKGARRPKGPFESAIDLLAICRVVFIHKASDALDLLTEAKLERRFRAATRSLSRLYAGYYVAELLNELTDEADPHPRLFDAAVSCLRALDGNGDVGANVLWFEMSALRLLGHLPSWDDCASCGKPISLSGRVPFGIHAGGVLCPRCRAGQRQVIGVQPQTLQLLRTFSSHTRSEGDVIEPPLALPAGGRGELRGLVNQFLANLIGRRPRMHQYLGDLAG